MTTSYRNLDIYSKSFGLFIKTHEFSLKLPKYELFELGSQLRRSSDSINSNIVEGYGRRRYKNDFLKFLTYSHASCDETINHLEKIRLLYPHLSEKAAGLISEYTIISRRIFKFIEYVVNSWKS